MEESSGADTEARLREIMREALGSLTEEERAELGVSEETLEAQLRPLLTPWFRFFASYDPAPALRAVRCPTLALFGEKDVQVDPRQNLEPMKKAMADHPDATIVELPGLNHLFQTCETGMPGEYAGIEETFAPAALDAVGDWIVERFVDQKR